MSWQQGLGCVILLFVCKSLVASSQSSDCQVNSWRPGADVGRDMRYDSFFFSHVALITLSVCSLEVYVSESGCWSAGLCLHMLREVPRIHCARVGVWASAYLCLFLCGTYSPQLCVTFTGLKLSAHQALRRLCSREVVGIRSPTLSSFSRNRAAAVSCCSSWESCVTLRIQPAVAFHFTAFIFFFKWACFRHELDFFSVHLMHHRF